MALILNEEQRMLKSSAKELLKEKGSIERCLRTLRDSKDPIGYDKRLWQEMSEMGWACLTIPEAYGGLDFGYTGLGQVLEETGRTLTPSPLISTVLLSTTAINLAGNVLQKETLLPAIASGELIVAFAHEEGKHHIEQPSKSKISAAGQEFILNAEKTMVADAHVANKFIVSALNESGEAIFLIVDSAAEGIKMETTRAMDSRFYSKITFTNVKISQDDILANEGALAKTLDIARIGLSAEMLGSVQEAFSRTLAYIKERQQFGTVIGKFQALQHRMAILFGEIELCKSIVIKALKAIDADDPNLSRLASLAKAKLGKTYQLASNEGIQMYGGIGMTDDEEIGFFLKRARVIQQLFGDSNFHLDRLARMKGY